MLPNWLIEARFAEECDLSKLLDFARRQPPGGERVVPGAYWGGGRFEPQLPELAIPGRFWRHNMKNLWGSSTNLNQVFLKRVLVDNPFSKKSPPAWSRFSRETMSFWGHPVTHFEKHLGKGEVELGSEAFYVRYGVDELDKAYFGALKALKNNHGKQW